ncbi:coatomer WD associated region-domain-containing protein, partial [Suillus subluteus]
MTIKAWDWDKQWKCIQVYEGHTHYIMNITFNPKDSNTFASACLDRTGVNYVDVYPGSDKPYLVTTGDDRTIKIWDYLSKSCVQTMEGHTNNQASLYSHPNLPIIISGSEDGTNTLSYALERAWVSRCAEMRMRWLWVFDEGIVVIKVFVLSGNLATLSDIATADGNRIPLSIKEIGTTEIFATALLHSPNGRFVTVVGDGEYIIYTALAWRNKAFGSGDSNTYAVLENKVKLRVFKNFKERGGAGMKGAGSWAVDAIYGGPVLGARGKGFVIFWDWESGDIVRRIDVDAKNVSLSFGRRTGTLVAVYRTTLIISSNLIEMPTIPKLEDGVEITDEGVEEAFDVVAEISDSVKTAKWIGDCFIYTTAGNRLNYLRHEYFWVSLSLSVVEYQTAVLRGDMDSAAEILPTLPKEQLNKVARFLEGRDLKELALQVTTDPDHKFDLSLQLDDLDTAVNIARSALESESETKWKAIGDRALTVWRFDLAQEAFEKRRGCRSSQRQLKRRVQTIWRFATLFQLGDAKSCVDLLVKTNRAPEAALFARTYAPSEVPKVVDIWRGELRSKNKGKIAGSIVHPSEHAELFEEGWEEALAREAGGPVDVNGDSDISPNESEET